MTLVQQFAGIPITLPGWTQVVAYLFLALMALAIGVAAWRAYLAHKNQPKLDEIHAKTNMILLILRGIQEGVEPEELRNAHYAPDNNEVTLDHGKPLVQ